VDDLRSLVHIGRTAAQAKNRLQMSDVAVRLGSLVAEATAGRSPSSAAQNASEVA
jgi:hypothetical protein